MGNTRYLFRGNRQLHRGKRSWWTGKVTALCGLAMRSRDVRRPSFPIFHEKCPTCEAVHVALGGL